MVDKKAMDMLESAIDAKIDKALRKAPKRAVAKVLSTDDDGIIWVNIPGGADRTPVRRTSADVSPGDMVTLTVENGRACIEGNPSNPSAGVEDVRKIAAAAEGAASKAQSAADEAARSTAAARSARTAAKEATGVAEAVNQHFWHRSEDPGGDGAGTGAFVTDVPKDDFLAAISSGTEPTDEEPLHNLLMNSDGMLLRRAKNVLASFTRSAVAFFDGLGHSDRNVVASFGFEGSFIGAAGGSRLEMTNRSMKLVDSGSDEYFEAVDMRDANGNLRMDETFVPSAPTSTFELQLIPSSTPSATVNGSPVEVTLAPNRRTIRINTEADVGDVVDVSYNTRSSYAKYYTIGIRNPDGYPCGPMSVAEGVMTAAESWASHAEGDGSEAYGKASHAEGRSVASGDLSHSEGIYSLAEGYASHAQNFGTIASIRAQTAMGRYNERDEQGLYALVIGNGDSSESRSDAFRVLWDGAAWSANPAGTRRNLGLGSFATKSSLAASDIPDLPASKITSGVFGLARGGTGTDNSTGRAARTFFAAPSSTSGAASWRFITDTDLPGTQVQTTVATVVTAGSASISSVGFRRRCGVCQLSLAFRPSSSTASGAAVTVGTLKEGYRPKNTCFIGDARWSGTITSAGVIQVLNSAGTAINDTRTICATWVD